MAHCTGYLNFINGPISHILLLILVHSQLTTELSILLTGLKTMSLNIAQQFMKGIVKKIFGLLKIQVKFLKIKVSKGAKIRNRYNQGPHLTQDTNGKV